MRPIDYNYKAPHFSKACTHNMECSNTPEINCIHTRYIRLSRHFVLASQGLLASLSYCTFVMEKCPRFPFCPVSNCYHATHTHTSYRVPDHPEQRAGRYGAELTKDHSELLCGRSHAPATLSMNYVYIAMNTITASITL